VNIKWQFIAYLLLLPSLFSSAKAEDLAFFEKNLGPAPEGFTWTLCHDGFLAVRKPDGWFFKEEGPSKNGTLSCFVTKEEIKGTAPFLTGFSLNIVPKIKEKTGGSPTAYMQRFIDTMAKETKETGGQIEEYIPLKKGVISSIALRTKRSLPDNNGSNPALTTTHFFLAGNDTTSTLYIASFESPSEQWKESWKTGEKMMQLIGFLSNK
jgi:hypothetical protein